MPSCLVIGPERSLYVGSSRSSVDAVNRPQVDEVPPTDGPPETTLTPPEDEGPSTAVIPATLSRESLPSSPLPPFTAGHHPSASTPQTMPEDRVGAIAPAQSLEPTPTVPQGLHAFTGTHAFTGENLDLAVAGGNMTRDAHSHTHFHWKPRLYLGGALAGEGKLGPPVVSDGHFPLYVFSNGILLFFFFDQASWFRQNLIFWPCFDCLP
ncbi:hypothetical protein FA13DRAFT_174953 [Coprinellus micaceus]|uniref:Uncharacterized protein n=1 Tax=Coprinellus micaceus TaxID=71717 RepID=A0A4Y7SG83_COPMI|nr:hypothetical protein FA13DRAFT_174953 [Coprinellus micaceus]